MAPGGLCWMLEMPVPQVGARRGYRMGSEETLLGHQLQCNAHRSSSSIPARGQLAAPCFQPYCMPSGTSCREQMSL